MQFKDLEKDNLQLFILNMIFLENFVHFKTMGKTKIHSQSFSSSLPLTYDLEKLLRLMLMRCDSVTAAAATSMSVCLPVRPMNGPPPLSAATAAQC